MLVIGELPVDEDFDGDDSANPNYAYRPAPEILTPEQLLRQS